MSNNRFKIEAKEKKSWWVSIYDTHTDQYLNGFIANSVKEAKINSGKIIERQMLDEQFNDAKEDLPSETDALKQKKKEFLNKIDSVVGLDKEFMQSMINEIDKELKDAEG